MTAPGIKDGICQYCELALGVGIEKYQTEYLIDDSIIDEVSNLINKLYVARYRRNSVPLTPIKGGKTLSLKTDENQILQNPCDRTIVQAVKRRNDCHALARVAVECVGKDIVCEDVCVIMHNDWLKRNHRYATEMQKRGYTLLTEQEKDRYRDMYWVARKSYNKRVIVSYIS